MQIRNKILTVVILAQFFISPLSQAITLEEISQPLPPANRLGVGSTPENAYKVSDADKKLSSKEASLDKNSEAVKDITYADLSLKKISKEIKLL